MEAALAREHKKAATWGMDQKASGYRRQQRARYRLVGLLDLPAAATKHLRDVFLAVAHRTPQRRHSPSVYRRHWHVERQQKGHHVELAERDGDVQRRAEVVIGNVQAAVVRVNAADFLRVA